MNFIYRIKLWFKCRKYKKHFKYWRENPDVFCEKYLGIKLYEYQKKLLREMNKHPEKFCPHGDNMTPLQVISVVCFLNFLKH